LAYPAILPAVPESDNQNREWYKVYKVLGFRKIGIGSRIIRKDQLIAPLKIAVIQDQDRVVDKAQRFIRLHKELKTAYLGQAAWADNPKLRIPSLRSTD
jgi:hypothetical protein